MAQRNIYRVRQDAWYLGRPGAHNLQRFRRPQTVTYFPVPTSAPGALRTQKPPPEGPNRVPGSLTYPLDAVVAESGRPDGFGGDRPPGCSHALPESAKPSWPARNASWTRFQWDEDPATRIAAYHGTHRTQSGPHEATWVRRAPNPADVAVQSVSKHNKMHPGDQALLMRTSALLEPAKRTHGRRSAARASLGGRWLGA